MESLNDGGGRLPDFVIIGAMKCGTSTLHEQLARRAAFFMSTPKEPNFFSDEDNWAQGLPSYRALFAAARPGQLCGESSTHYTKLPTHPHACERLARHLPDARLVYVMRDPVARLGSQYVHEWSQREVAGGFEEAVARHERYVAYSSYARQLEPYVAAFGRERILLVTMERMLAQPDDELERVCRFLGEAPGGDPVRWRDDIGAQNVSRERMRKSRLRSALLAVPGVRAVVDRIPHGPRERLKALWRIERRPELSPRLRADVEARLDEDLARLGAWVGLPLTCSTWKSLVTSRPMQWSAAATSGGTR